LRAQLEVLGIGPKELADEVGVTRQAIYQLQNGGTRDSYQWDAIVKAIKKRGGSAPRGRKPDDDRFREFTELWPDMTSEDHEVLIATARRLTKKP
jgi:hypothetical protein